MDIDDEILALAGGGESLKRKRSSRKVQDLVQSDGEDEALLYGDNSDSDEEDSEWAEMKKWGDDLIGDEEDRRRLDAMSELDKEKLLAERAEKLQLVKDRLELKRKVKGAGRDRPRKQDDQDRRISSRKSSDRKKASKSLHDLRRQRDEKSSRKTDGESRRRLTSYSSQSESEREGEAAEPGAIPETVEETTTPTVEKVSLQKFMDITLTRSDIEKWLYAPFFKEVVTGCYLRIGLGVDADKKPTYRVVKIADVVDYHKPYHIGQSLTKKAVYAAHGKAKKVFTFDIASNQPITEAEFSRYLRTLENENEPMVSLAFVESKSRELARARAHEFSNDEIENMIKEKQALARVPHNIASEKLRLKRDLDEAMERNDEREIERLKEKLAKLEEIALEKRKTFTGSERGVPRQVDDGRDVNRVQDDRASNSPALTKGQSTPTIKSAIDNTLRMKKAAEKRKNVNVLGEGPLAFEEKFFENDDFLDTVVFAAGTFGV
ncbi:RNA polymerase-associated protein rtf1 [Blyttiomyces sp. JEL0837]|nr:RNA polymerase-associated protein rtf1 [Blyttiomyces sp. JEL0837]